MKLDRNRIKLIMISKCLNVKDLTKVSGLSGTTVNRIVNHDATCNLNTIGKIAIALDVNPSELIESDGKKCLKN